MSHEISPESKIKRITFHLKFQSKIEINAYEFGFLMILKFTTNINSLYSKMVYTNCVALK